MYLFLDYVMFLIVSPRIHMFKNRNLREKSCITDTLFIWVIRSNGGNMYASSTPEASTKECSNTGLQRNYPYNVHIHDYVLYTLLQVCVRTNTRALVYS